ncbi:MAG: MoaD/ThiS family protein [Planctomycetes bacterium]|nr:MoaD/ThiS family protein [Planctomycetota bacterium]
MAINVRIPTALRALTGEAAVVPAEGKTVGEVIRHLGARFAGIGPRICDETGKVRRFVNLYLNDEDVRFLKNLDTPVKEGDEISIVPAIAGGGGLVARQ